MSSTVDKLVRITTGLPGLDIITDGGLFLGGLYLVQGTPGTGKTTLANQMCFHRAAEGGRSLYVTLLSEYHSRMVQHLGAMSFFDTSSIPDRVTYVSAFSTMRNEGLPGLLAFMRRELIAKRITFLVVDGLINAKRAITQDPLFNEFIHELQGIALATNCTVLLVASTDRHAANAPEHTMVDGIIELSDQAFGWAVERALIVTKIRGSDYMRGKHTYKITNDGVVVFPRIEALLASPSMADLGQSDRVTSGNAQLDDMLRGGLPENSPTILLGPSGIGKTTFGLQYLSRSSAAEPGLLFGFYETPARILAKAHSVCPALPRLLSQGDVEMLWQCPYSESLDAYGDRLIAAVRRRGVRRLFLDGLGALKSAPNAQERLREFLPALTNELRVQGVTSVYTLEVGNIVGPGTDVPFREYSLLAENLVLLRYVERGPRLHRLISILKVRDSDFDPYMREFMMTAEGPQILASHDSAALSRDSHGQPESASTATSSATR